MPDNSLRTAAGDGLNKKILLYLAIMFLGIYMMPKTVALFAGQHTFYSGMNVPCEKCHADILAQIEMSGYVFEKHKAAAGNTNYTTYLSLGGKAYSNGAITAYDGKIWTWNLTQKAWQNGSDLRNISLDKNNNGIDGDEICLLCHNATLAGSSVHTGIIIRTCDDDRCHGSREYAYNSPEILGSSSNITAAGYDLGQTNAHQSFYLGLSNQSSRYVASTAFGQPGNTYASSSFISRGHWACEGCHTEAVANINIIPAQPYNHTVSNPDKKRYN